MALVNGGDNLLTHRDQPLKRLFIVPESIEGRQNEEAVKRRVVFMGAHKDAAGRGEDTEDEAPVLSPRRSSVPGSDRKRNDRSKRRGIDPSRR